MMRSITLMGILALASGCAAIDSDLQYRGTLDTQTNGIVLFEDGEAGHAAMAGTTCVIDPDGGVADDVDIEGSEDDQILDGSRNDDGSVVLARTRGTLHLIEPLMEMSWDVGFDDPRVTASIPVANVQDAMLLDDGIAALTDCGVQFLDRDGELISEGLLNDVGCTGMEPGFDVDRLTNTAFVAMGDIVASVSADQVTTLPVSGDLIAFSTDAGGLAVATHGSNEVSFLDADGSVRWTASVAGRIADIADLGARGSVAVVHETGTGDGRLAILDAETGLEQRGFDLPGTADIVTSANGRTLALVVDNKVHYYNLR